MKPDHIYKLIIIGLGLTSVVLLATLAGGEHIETVIAFLGGWMLPNKLAGAK